MNFDYELFWGSDCYRAQTVMVTGHRPQRLGGGNRNSTFRRGLREELRMRVRSCIDNLGHTIFMSGGALGADQDFLQAALSVRQHTEQDIAVVAALPFVGFGSNWSDDDQDWLDLLLAQCHTYYVSGPGYAAWKLMARNQWMLARSSHVVAVWDGVETGGTWNTIRIAKEMGLSLDIIEVGG